jgi:hypothetical protein
MSINDSLVEGNTNKPKFDPGKVVMTRGAMAMADQGCNLLGYLARHLLGDWGDLEQEDWQENELSLSNGFRLLSSYNTDQGKLWIITEADRSVTTFLRPDEY